MKDTNGHIGVECFNLLKPYGTIPLGVCNSNIRFSQKLHQLSVRGTFLRLFCRTKRGVNNEKQNLSQTEI